MSFGRINFIGADIASNLQWLGGHEEVRRRWPQTSQLLQELAKVMEKMERYIDRDLSEDTRIADDAAFDSQTVAAVLDAAKKFGPEREEGT